MRPHKPLVYCGQADAPGGRDDERLRQQRKSLQLDGARHLSERWFLFLFSS